jgi:hypothetical protein
MEWYPAQNAWLSRLLIERSLGAIYLLAFVVARNQFRPLLGDRGLLPVARYLRVASFKHAPSLFQLGYSDRFFGVCAWTGILLSTAVVAGLPDRGPLWLPILVWLALWLMYLSIVNVGQTFYGFGWESLLLEAGFLVAFLGNGRVAPPLLVLWLMRWLVFRLEFGAGLIKLRGDPCWRQLTCLYYHHETQPMPNPLSWYFHHLPRRIHRVEVLANHIAQLVVPFGLFGPQPVADVAGIVIIITQLWLVLSGNFSWLNVLTIVVAFSALDDRLLHHVLPWVHVPFHHTVTWFEVVVIGVAAIVALLSYWPIRNLVSGRQRMNYSFNRLHLVNTYGAFGSVTRVRYEVAIEGTNDPGGEPQADWREYEFKGKPTDPSRRPPQVAPYHLRLDWLMWFAALSPAYADGWLITLVRRLLEGDPATLRLLRRDPFAGHPPAMVRARFYRYRFTSRAERRETRAWWVRTLIGEYMRPVSLTTLDSDPPRLAGRL